MIFSTTAEVRFLLLRLRGATAAASSGVIAKGQLDPACTVKEAHPQENAREP